MITSKDVFSKRKEGELDEAYSMAVELINNPTQDEWDIKAFAWCVIDLIKRDAQSGQRHNLSNYADQIRNLEIDPTDKILSDQRDYVLRLCNPNGQEILKAKSLSKQGNNLESLNIFNKIFSNGDQSSEVQVGMAWEMYRVAKAMVEQEPANFNGAKRHINDYFKLDIDKPSLLHTCFLQLADKIAKEGKLNMGAFARIWGLEYLRPEDYEPYQTSDGKSYPSLAERVVQHASKDAFLSADLEDLQYILPFINNCINRYPDNLWLKLSKARVLMTTGQSNEALSFGLEVVKNKVNDYWAWELLGDIHQSIALDIALSCYCKALLCSKDINFIAKVKVKLAEILAHKGSYSEAKFEIESVINYRVDNNQKIPEPAEILRRSSWYEGVSANTSNKHFYREMAPLAEELLYSDLPWINGILGDTFFIKEQKNKPKRKLYIQSNHLPIEIIVSEFKIPSNVKKMGSGIKIKGEYDYKNRFQVYTIEHRHAQEDWDIFDELIGVVDHVNHTKNLLHFMVSRVISGVIRFSDLSDRFHEGDAIAVRLSEYASNQGARYKVLTATKTNQPIPESLLKSFNDSVRQENGMGFTNDGIFIPPPLVSSNNIKNTDFVAGKAILNYNKKRSEWGWKAISISSVSSGHDN